MWNPTASSPTTPPRNATSRVNSDRLRTITADEVLNKQKTPFESHPLPSQPEDTLEITTEWQGHLRATSQPASIDGNLSNPVHRSLFSLLHSSPSRRERQASDNSGDTFERLRSQSASPTQKILRIFRLDGWVTPIPRIQIEPILVPRVEETFHSPAQIQAGISRIKDWADRSEETEKIAATLRALEEDAILSFSQQGELYRALQAHMAIVPDKHVTQRMLEPYFTHFKPRAASFNQHGASLVRSSGELTAADVKATIKNDLRPMNMKDLHAIFSALSPDTDPKLARQVLQYMAQWSTADSIVGMCESLSSLHKGRKAPLQGKKIATNGGAALGDILRYLVGHSEKPKPLNQYGNLFDQQKSDFKGLPANRSIVVDQHVLHLLEQDKELFEKLAKGSYYLVVPRGWEAGANLFSLHDPDLIGQKLQTICNQVKANEQSGMSRNDAIQYTLELPVRQKLIALFKKHCGESFKQRKDSGQLTDEGMLEQLMGKKLFFFNSGRFKPLSAPSEVELLKLFKRDPRLKKKHIEALMKKLPPDQQQPFLELLGQGLQAFSPRRMSIELRKLHQNILAQAEEKGIPTDQIYFYIPEDPRSKVSLKSHTLVTNQYCVVNNIPPRQVITNYEQLPSEGNRMLVVLDDFSGSGHSLAAVATRIQEAEALKENGSQLHVVIAPNVASNKTMSLLQEGGPFNMPRLAGKKWQSVKEEYRPQPTITITPGSISPNLRTTHYYQFLPPEQKRHFDDLMGRNGYADCSTFTGFWWMSPTNNIRSTVAKDVLETLLLNKLGYR